MNIDSLIPWALTAAIGAIGWFVRVLWDADKELRDGLFRLRESQMELPRIFVMREDYHRDIFEIKELLREIRTGMDGKANK